MSNTSLSDPSRLTPTEKKSTHALAAIFALRMLGLFLILPVFAVYAKGICSDNSAFLVGLTLGIYGLTQGILQIPYGVASDRIGRRPVIVFGLIVFAIGSAIAGATDNIYTVLIGRSIQGAGAISAAVTAMLADSVRERVLTRSMALVGSSIGITFAFSLIVSPILSTYIGVPGLFWLTALLSVMAIGVMLWIVPDVPAKKTTRPTLHQPWPKVVFHPQLLLLNLGIFVLHMVLMALFVVIPLELNALGMPVSSHWSVYLPTVLLSFVFMMPSIIFCERRQRTKELFISAIALLALVYLALWLMPASITVIAVLLFLFFVGFNILEASLPSLVSKIAPSSDKGLALGVYNTTQSIGLFVGGAWGGSIASRYGSAGVYMACALLILVWLAFSFAMNPVKRKAFGQAIKID